MTSVMMLCFAGVFPYPGWPRQSCARHGPANPADQHRQTPGVLLVLLPNAICPGRKFQRRSGPEYPCGSQCSAVPGRGVGCPTGPKGSASGSGVYRGESSASGSGCQVASSAHGGAP